MNLEFARRDIIKQIDELWYNNNNGKRDKINLN